MAPDTARRPWSEDELRDLAAIKPFGRGAIARFIAKHDHRTYAATTGQLMKLRIKGAARDITKPHLDRSLLTNRGRSL